MNNKNSHLRTLNCLNHPIISRKMSYEELHPESPLAIKENLKLDELAGALFPTLVTGVRWWPFLCLANQFKSDTDYPNVFATTTRLMEDLGTNAGTGPRTKSSFRPYLSMARNIDSSSNCSDLKVFLNKLQFKGDKKFFYQNGRSDQWKEYFLKLNGAPGSAYVKAHRLASKLILEPSVIDVIDVVLKNPSNKFNKLLWRGCFSYAFLRCLFGRFDSQSKEQVSYSFYVEGWRDILIKVMKSGAPDIPQTACIPAYIALLEKIEDRNSPPPLAHQAKLFRSMDRPIVAALKIPLFHNLYFKPMPARIYQ